MTNERIETINKAIDRLQTLYDCNHECMDADDVGDLLVTMQSLKDMRDELQQIYERTASITTELIPEYVEEYDHTFIMEATYVNGECVSMECVGWYCGEPDDKYVKEYANRNMKADYSK